MKHASIKQHDITDCGAACLATISKQYGLSKALGSTPNRQEGQTPKDSDNLPRSSKVMSCWFISHKIIIQ